MSKTEKHLRISIWSALCQAARNVPEQCRQTCRILLGVVFAGTVLLASAWGLSILAGIPPSDLTRDALQVLGGHCYIGCLSSLGVLFWMAATASCLIAAAVFSRLPDQKEAALFYLYFGLLSLLLTLDDLFLIHEKIWPFFTGLPQYAVSVFYALLVSGGIIRFRATLLRGPWLLLILSAGILGISAVVDTHVVLAEHKHHIFMEDSFKLFGILLWCSCFVRFSLNDLTHALQGSHS